MQIFWLINLQFLVYTVAALTYFAAAWLFWDARKVSKVAHIKSKAIGFWLMTAAAVLGIFRTESELIEVLHYGMLAIGLAVTLYGVYQEHIIKAPSVLKVQKAHGIVPAILLLIPFVNAIIAGATTVLLQRRFKAGLVKEYKYWMWSWALLSLSLFVSGFGYFRNSDNVNLEQIGLNYGLVWLAALLLHLASTLVLGYWIWQFIRFRDEPQLFLSFVALCVLVTTIVAVGYSTFLFIKNENDLEVQLSTTAQTAAFNIAEAKQSALTTANFLAKSEIIRSTLERNDLTSLFNTVHEYAENAADIDYILVADNSGTILVKTNEPEIVGDTTLSEDPVVVHAVNNQESRVTIVTPKDVLADRLEVVATAPVINSEGSTAGVIQTAFVLDNAYADDVKAQTGLEASIYTGDRRSATTLLASDGKSRAENTVETDSAVSESVLVNRSTYVGTNTILNVPYYMAYAPLFDVNNNVVGMISVAREQILLIEATKSTIFATFIIATIVAALSLVPAHYLSRYMQRN